MSLPPHPVSEKKAGVWHAVIAAFYAFALWYHLSAARNHFRDANK